MDAPATEFRYEGEYVIDTEYARRTASSFFRYASVMPARIVPPVLIIVATIVAAVGLGGIWWVFPFGAIAGFFISIPITIRRTRKRIEAVAPAGSTFRIGLAGDFIRIAAPLATTDVRYAAYESVGSRGQAVFLKQRSSRIYSVLPAQLFTPEALSWLTTAIADPLRRD